MQNQQTAATYADQLTTQLKKGVLTYLVLLICQKPIYTSEILDRLKSSGLAVVEGTIYPLLARMQKDALLTHIWQESPTGPPRKYYQITPYGHLVQAELAANIDKIHTVTAKLRKEQK